MQINRQNYEQYLLLYADGELTASQRIIVQQFVAEHKDLSIELAMIQAAILPIDEIRLTDKNFLYKGVDYKTQEKLLLKLDNELPTLALADVDILINTNTNTKEAFELLEKTRLDKNEKIVFEHKHLLYKKERDNVVVFGYLRWAAAAVFIGIALFTGIKFFNNKNTTDTAIAITPDTKNVENRTINNTGNDNVPNKIENTIANNVAQNNDAITTPNQKNTIQNLVISKQNNTETQKNVNNKNIVTNKNYQRITNNKEENNTNNNQNNFIANNEIVIPQQNNTVVENNTLIAKTSTTNNTINTERLYELENTYAYQNVVQKLEEDNVENKILYMDESKVKKSKVGMFFSKIKKAVTKSAKVKPGSTIQVAGFEISAN